jgi:hypothetical protein
MATVKADIFLAGFMCVMKHALSPERAMLRRRSNRLQGNHLRVGYGMDRERQANAGETNGLGKDVMGNQKW